MITWRTAATPVALTAAYAGVPLTATTPATAGGVGDFLSPAFGTSCANLLTGARAAGTTTHGTGADAPAAPQDAIEDIAVQDSVKNPNVLGVAVQE
ncbi:hypothetical protein [Streptomyces sp. NPDC023327]|uniref:hypothetical protein n=1 Tax=Streptomyces sp. NPDC023327 TaxID=3157088 RepID=UPI003402AB63